MAKDLTDVNTYTAAITVPEGDDPRAHAAESLELAAQGLANRTTWLHGYVARAILADDVTRSVFTVPIQGDTTSPRDPVLRAGKGPHDDPGKPTNPWKEFLRAYNQASTDAQRSGLYFGDGAQGLVGLVVNAMWRDDHGSPPGQWEQLDATKASYFVYINQDGDLRLSKKALGASPWATWDTTTACKIGAPNMEADTIQVNTLLECLTGAASVNGWSYVTAQSRTTPIRVSGVFGDARFDVPTNEVHFFDLTVDVAEFEMGFAINVPVGAIVDRIRVRHVQSTGSGDRWSLMRRTNQGSGTFTVDELAFKVASNTITTGTNKVTTIDDAGDPLGYEVQAGDELYLRWKIVDSGTLDAITNNAWLAAEVDWSEVTLSYQ